MKPMDQAGNVLNKGDFVVIVDDGHMAYGIIQEISEGGLIAPGTAVDPKGRVQGMEMPGMMTIMLLPLSVPFNSRQPYRCPGITKAVKPPGMGDLGGSA